jgi:hypothetical protein
MTTTEPYSLTHFPRVTLHSAMCFSSYSADVTDSNLQPETLQKHIRLSSSSRIINNNNNSTHNHQLTTN